jgi:hypothetical protein
VSGIVGSNVFSLLRLFEGGVEFGMPPEFFKEGAAKTSSSFTIVNSMPEAAEPR